MSPSLVIELAPFSLALNTSESDLLAHSERLEREFLSQRPGYLGRALTQLKDGRWADVVLWASQEAADAVMAHVPDSAACAAYFGCMAGADPADPASGVTHFRSRATYGVLQPLAHTP